MLSLESMRWLIEQAAGAQQCWDTSGACILVNSSFSELFGVGPSAPLGEGWLDLIHAEDRTDLRGALDALLEGEPRRQLELRAGGLSRKRWLRVTLVRLHERGALLGVLGLWENRQDLLDAQNALLESRLLLRLIERTTQLGTFRVSRSTGEAQWSEAVHRVHGTDPRTFRPSVEAAISAFSPSERERLRVLFASALEKAEEASDEHEALEASFSFDGLITRQDGQVRFTRCAGAPFCHPSGEISLVGVVQDVTETRGLLERLRESEERLALALTATADGLWDWDVEGGALWWSDRFREMLGLSPGGASLRQEDLIGRLHPEDREATLEAIRAHLEERRPYDVQHRLRDEAGRWRWIREKGQAVFNDQGVPKRMVGTVTDITGEVEARRALVDRTEELERKSEALERSHSEMARLAAVSAHDMKEPLRRIRTYCDLALESSEALDRRTAGFLERMRGSVERLHALLRDLHEMASMSRAPLNPVRVDLGQVANRVVTSLSNAISRVGATIEIGPLPLVRAEPAQMASLLHNLIENALKYRHSGRPCRIVLGSVAPPRSGVASFFVEDNGVGFPPEHATRIFGLFERLHGPAYPGTGLGLTLCARVVEAHGGTISAEGRAGWGARFVVQLPSELGEEGGEGREPEIADRVRLRG